MTVRMKCGGLTKCIPPLLMLLGVSCFVNGEKHKRQIYREQLLPALGGKIPEEAFRTDRLALNRLNKDGITVVDGVLLEARDVDRNPDNVRSKPEVIKVYVTQDPRYVPPEGRYHNERPKSVDTTYVLRKPVGHHDGSERQRLNGLGNAPSQNCHHYSNNNNNQRYSGGYRKAPEVPPQGLSPPKAHGYANFHRFLPTGQTSAHRPGQQQQQRHYQTIYKPIVAPLVLPARDVIIKKPYRHQNANFHPSWDLSYDWAPFFNPREPVFLEDTSNFFDSHQIINDYEGFLDTFHGRSYRHIGSPKVEEIRKNSSKDNGAPERTNAVLNADQGRPPFNIANDRSKGRDPSMVSKNVSLRYTDLTRVPETSFSCEGRKGTFADVETKCQVFHECSGWSKTSSLCPAGTAYSTVKKRCEWWNTVTCILEDRLLVVCTSSGLDGRHSRKPVWS